jgi:SAM-dependent methyltransferase
MASTPDYGIDAPGVIRNLIVIGLLLLVGAVMPSFGPVRFSDNLRVTMFITGLICAVEAALMILYAKVGKFSHRDRMLAVVPWKGSEEVLDVGTGRGLLLIGAAKRLTSGNAVGVDVWSTKDLSGNAAENTVQNAEIEGVKDKVQLLSEDAQKMSFPDSTFDVVLSNLCIHNLPSAAGRVKACQEIARVLKPGGIAVIADFIHTARYLETFQRAGLNATRSRIDVRTFPPLRIITARK